MTAARTAAATVGIAALLVGLSACGSDSSSDSTDPASKAPKRNAGAGSYLSTHVKVDSPYVRINLTGSTLDHGKWTYPQVPPSTIFGSWDGSVGQEDPNAMFWAESDGFMTGIEGSATYASDDPASPGQVVIRFNNPFSGSTTASCDASGQLTCTMRLSDYNSDSGLQNVYVAVNKAAQ